MITKTRKIMALILFVIISVASVPVSAFATNAPRVAVQISMATDADKTGEVGPGDEISVTVTWKGVLASSGEPITIQVTNGAEILIYNEGDVVFQANGTPASIKPVTRTPNGETVTFASGSPATSPLENKITFKVKAPSSAGNFNLSIRIGTNTTPNKPLINFVEEELTVNP